MPRALSKALASNLRALRALEVCVFLREKQEVAPPTPRLQGPLGEQCSVWKVDEPGKGSGGALSLVISLEICALFPLIDRPPRRPSAELSTFILDVMETHCTEGSLDLLGLAPV